MEMKGSYSKHIMLLTEFSYIIFEVCYSSQNIVGRLKEPEHAMDARDPTLNYMLITHQAHASVKNQRTLHRIPECCLTGLNFHALLFCFVFSTIFEIRKSLPFIGLKGELPNAMKRFVEQPTSLTTVYFYTHTKEANSSEILDLWIGLRVEDFVPNLCV